MTKDEQQSEIAAMVTKRNELRRTVACLEQKLDRISEALSEVRSAIREGEPLRSTTDGEIFAAGDGTPLPPVAEIARAQNDLLDASRRLEEVERRLEISSRRSVDPQRRLVRLRAYPSASPARPHRGSHRSECSEG